MLFCFRTCARCEESTLTRSTSSAADSRARTSAKRAEELASVVLEAAFGSKCCDSSENSDHDMSPSKTLQRSDGEDLTSFSKGLPHAGIMHSGGVSELTISALRTAGKGSLLWPTATAMDAKSSTRAWLDRWIQAGGHWPTPGASNFNLSETPDTWMARKARGEAKGIRNGLVLGIAVQLWNIRRHPSTMQGGRIIWPKVALNPRFSEALMGFPRGFVTRSLEPSEMPLFQHVQRSRDT